MTGPDRPHLSVVMPAFNESARIASSVHDVVHFLADQPYRSEFIVVDDGSTDATVEIAEQAFAGRPGCRVIRRPENRGKGAAVKAGMGDATGRLRLFTDVDLSTPIDEVTRFMAHCEAGHDVVIGSRRVRGARFGRRQPLFREISGRVFSVLSRLLILPGFIDTQCGFKMFRAEAAEAIFPLLTIEGFGFDVEVLYIAARKKGFRVLEAPVFWTDSPRSKVRMFTDARAMAADLIRIRRNDAAGRYGASSAAAVR